MCVCVCPETLFHKPPRSLSKSHIRNATVNPPIFVILKHKCVYSVCPCISFYLMPRSELVPFLAQQERIKLCVGEKNNQHNEFGSHFSIVTEFGL